MKPNSGITCLAPLLRNPLRRVGCEGSSTGTAKSAFVSEDTKGEQSRFKSRRVTNRSDHVPELSTGLDSNLFTPGTNATFVALWFR